MSIALDKKIHANIKAGDWPGALDLSSYYLPFVGAGRNSWDAWHANQYWRAAGHASLLGIEVVGLLGAGKVRWGRVKAVKNTPKATQGAKQSGKQLPNFVLTGMDKAEARCLASNMGLNPAQLASVNTAIKKMTTTDVSKITQDGPNVILQSFRLGHNGYQIIETTVRIDGSKGVIQKAYNESGQLVHYHIKK